MVESYKTLMLCLNRIGCPKDIKGLIKNKIIEKKVAIDLFGFKEEWFELFGKKHGLYRMCCPSGQLKYKIMYQDGKRNGLCREWYLTGQLWFECVYKNDKKNGMCREWYSGGQLKYKIMYQDGVGIGVGRLWYPTGQLLHETRFEDR